MAMHQLKRLHWRNTTTYLAVALAVQVTLPSRWISPTVLGNLDLGKAAGTF